MGKLSARFQREIDLYIRQLAWLHAAPRPRDRGRGQPVADPQPRMQQMLDAGQKLPLPPCPWREGVEMLKEAGRIQLTGQGRAPLSWAEINAWDAASERRMRPWDRRMIRRMSETYLAELSEAEEEGCPSPWWPEDADDGAIEAQLERGFAGLERQLKHAMPGAGKG